MELYISDHPLDCLTCPANGDCELQDMAGVVGLREVRYGYEGANHLDAVRRTRQQPVLRLRPVQVHRLLALRARLRGGPGHVRADHRRPRLRVDGGARCRRAVHGLGVRVLRRLRAAACPTATLQEKSGDPAAASPTRSVVTTCAYCGVGCSFKAEMKRQRGGAHGAVQGRPGANEGHSCVKGRFAWGYATHQDRITAADDPRRRSPIRGAKSSGTRRSTTRRPRMLDASRRQHGRGRDRRDHLLALHERRDLPRAEAGARRASATTTSTPARACATRRPATA